MKFFCLITLGMIGTGLAAAVEFHGPETYPVDRYIPLWNKNPFTLKTAPAALQKESFAKDLALAGITRIGADITVLLVNTKTREYLKLKNEEQHASGMKVKSVNMKDTRSDSSVEVIMGSESSVLKYDDAFLKQMASQVPAPANAPGNNGVVPMPVMPGVPMPSQGAPGAVPSPGMGGGSRPGVTPPPMPINASPMTNPQQMIPTIPTRRVRTAPVQRSNSAAPNPAPPIPAAPNP